MADDIAIKVENVSKTFKLPHEKNTSIKSSVINFYKRNRTFEKQQALNGVSFEVKKGEFFGIVGRNGSGKSTLLKLLAGIYSPDEGSVQINGKLTPFIELGVGFSPELTGRENVFLNGALLGFSRKEMQKMYDDIVSFAEIERFMDQKLKNYSSGMQVRLAFSIAIRVTSNILLIDEVLAVGDIAFQQKCYDYFDKLKEEKRTIVLVTHDMSAVKQFCDRALIITDGCIKSIGDPEEVSQMYEKDNYARNNDVVEQKEEQKEENVSLITLDKLNNTKQNFEYGENIQLALSWPKEQQAGIVGIVIYKGTEVVFATNTIGQKCNLKAGKVTLKLNDLLGAGRYKAAATIFGRNSKIVITRSKMQSFLVYNQPSKGKHDDEWNGITYLENEWL
jgi:ABC-2 type transport system ATP-binding protein